MGKGDRDQIIKSIIKMEERICQCDRCESLVKCTSKPSLGKGDLEPKVILVFENENSFTSDKERVIELANLIKKDLKTNEVYYTFLVRCHPKACSSRQSNDCFITSKLLDRNNICLFTKQPCNGVPIKPLNEEIINCLTYLTEELSILQPEYVILFGNQVSNFVLKSYGVFDSVQINQAYKYENITFITSEEENIFDYEGFHNLSAIIIP